MFPEFRNSIALRKVPRLRPFVIPVRAIRRWRWVWSIGGMIVTGGNWSSGRQTCASAILPIINLEWTGLGSNTGLLDYKTNLRSILGSFCPYRAVNTLPLGYKSSHLIMYREIIAVCSQIHTKHINTVYGQNVELLNVKLVVNIVTTVRYI